jgi:hypothetical protein
MAAMRSDHSGWRKVRGWFSQPPILLLLIGVLIPNLVFVVLALGGLFVPPRTLPLILYILVAASLRFAPPMLVACLYLAALLFDIVFCATQFFGLAPQEAFFALRFIQELEILNSQLYAALTVVLLGSLGSVLYLLFRHGRSVGRASWMPLLMGGLVLIPVDMAANAQQQGTSWLGLGAEPPFESAAEKSGFQELVAHPNGRPMLVVIVEALGHFADPAHQKLLDDTLATPQLAARYALSSGRNTFMGSTTAGEMRELCATRQSYLDFMDRDLPDCAAFRLRAAGYEASAYHGFTASMFERARWWPRIGFQHSHFGESIHESGRRLCGEVFIGICDPDMLSRIEAELRKNTPQFVYLLTLNTHIPVSLSESYGNLDCQQANPLGDVGVCIMTDHWIELLAGLSDILADPTMPAVEVLIVGDHAPPLWYRKARNLFEAGQVSWYRLTPR